MEYSRHILPSSHSTQQLALEAANRLSRARQPLSDAAGNAQLHTLASVGLYNDSKGLQPRVDRRMYPIPTVPSQPARNSLGNTLELRRQSSRRRGHHKFSRNPIVDSPQYQAYRARQSREGNPDDAKWPEVLEMAFLDALIDIPKMGRRKYSYRGKPHGRNELIKEYLWIAYLQSLGHGQSPDENMARTRKQVSSHIQVLKGFLKGHPAYNRLFPVKDAPKNGFEDSFKNDPTLRALTEGRLPNRRYEQFGNINQMATTSHTPMRPAVFWLLITSSSVPDDVSGRYTSEEDLYRDGVIAHKYTGLKSHRRRDNLESISNWRQRFPLLERIYSSNELACEIVHMDVSLELMRRYAPDGAELVTRMEMSVQGRESAGYQWQTVTSLFKPPELHHLDSNLDPPMEHKTFITEVLAINETETRIKVPFPANAWAHAFTCLTNLQIAHEESRKVQSFGADANGGPTRSAREFVDKISMYQEVQSSPGQGRPFQTRAIILWTFHKARHGEEGSASWRYLDPLPPRRLCMSPSPHPSHQVSAAMSETFNTWVDPPIHLQAQNMLDPFVQGIATPPHTAGLQSPFATQGYGYAGQHFDIPQENLSFISNATVDSDSTLVENETAASIDTFLSNTNVSLGDFDQNGNSWHMPHAESFDTDPSWANYTVPATIPQLNWESEQKQNWPEASPAKQTTWIDETSAKHDWNENIASPTKEDQNYIEQTIEQKLVPWIEHHPDVDGEPKHSFSESSDGRLPDLDRGRMAKDQGWAGEDSGFDYNHLADRLK